MKKKIIIIVSVVLVVSLIVTYGVAMHIRNRIPENPAGTVGTTSGNLQNGGLFCENGGYVYFSNPYDNNSLYRMRPDESEMERLTTTQVNNINADGKFLYYYQESSIGGTGFGAIVNAIGIFRTEKKNPQNIVCLDKTLAKNVILADNSVYYVASTDTGVVSLNRIGINGSNKETLLDADILPIGIQNTTFYYIESANGYYLMALDVNTGISRQILADELYMPIVEGSTVYGIDIHDHYALVRVDLFTGAKTVLDSTRTDFINVTSNYIYYQTSGENPQLKRIAKNGSGMEVVANGAYNSINATSAYVYFVSYNSTVPVYKTPAEGAVRVTTFDTASKAATEAIKQ